MGTVNSSKVGNLSITTGKEKHSIFLDFIYDHPQLIFIFILAVLTYLVIASVRRYHRLRDFQGPPLAAWTKLWLLKTVTSGRMHQIFYTTTKKYGSMVRIAPNSLMTSDATLWRRICAVRSPYVRADWYKGMRFEPDKDIVLTYSDEKHTEMRSKLAAGYAGKESENFEKDMDARIAELLELIRNKYISDDHSYKPFDWGLMSSNLTLDVVTELGFSHCIGNIKSNSDLYDYYGITAEGLPIVQTLTVFPWIVTMFENSSILKWIMPSTEDKHGFAKKRARERFGPGKLEKRDMLGSFIRHGITQKEAEAETIVQLMAGTDPAATALRVAILYIITQPQVHRRLLDEFQANGLLSERSNETIVSFATASKMPYLQACIKETLRIWPPFCGLMEKVVPPGGDVLADGRKLPEGTHIGLSFWGMMRDPEVFGDDTDIFRPERWINTENERLRVMERTVECGFSSGRYTCLGKDLAILQVNKVIVEAYSSAGLYAIANNVLSTNNVFYTPAQHGYDRALDTFLNWVDFGSNANPGLDAALLDAITEQQDSQAALDSATARAEARWTKDVKRGMTDQPFAVWLDMGKAPDCTAARQQADMVSQKITQIQVQMGGPMANTVRSDRDSLSMGRNMGSDFPGYNMKAASGGNLSNVELLNKERSGESIPDPLTSRVPLYQSPECEAFVKDAVTEAASGDYSSHNRIEVDIDTDKDTSDYNFGQPDDASVNAGTPWFSFGDSTLDTGSESSEVEVVVTYNDIRAVTVQPGQWNVDLSKYKLRSEAPNEVKTLSRASQVVVVAGLGFEITVGESTAETLDSELEETTNAGGSISVFGITINLGDAGKNTHTTSWDKDFRTFKVVPDFDNNITTVVGVVA
ncbi:uncharacterized protein FIESC28_03450 [Fusarium coffeatum]|uniref:Uncharacterized protein n=1 Tax=Fusarium coffeatum TaxID=231269 RepID=A0A366S518_9HYPO|nr:uncharacterized protein FIESC28_03450 [Fusarium coffeatum]RBR23745.1 hypothetical protein FIESC28_03450 [Fusarium coffeatum]